MGERANRTGRWRALVAGVGSPHGDDRVGWLVVESLTGSVRADVGLLALRSPCELLDHLGPDQRLIVVDACQAGAPPGRIERYVWPEMGLSGTSPLARHGLPLDEVLRLAADLHILPPRATLFAVQVASCRPMSDLSPEVREALPRVKAMILDEIGATGESD